MPAEIEVALAPLVGLPMWGAVRAANVLSLQFGAPRAAATTREPERQVGAFALHVFCAWRLTRGDEIVVGAGDLFTPADPNADPEDFDWEAPGATWWDVGVRDVLGPDAKVRLVVEAVSVDRVGGFSLRCSTDFVLDVFPSSAPAAHVETEFWRLSAPATSEPHLVLDTTGLHREG